MPVDRKILNSWKEIASYIGRGIRTVQCWERDFHLPVRRLGGHDRSAVIAFSDEIDQWLASTPMKNGRPHATTDANVPPRTRQLAELVQSTAQTLVRSAEKLQKSALRAREQQQRRQKQRNR